MTTKHIGIVGCSAEGAALCYKTICVEGETWLGRRYAHPEVSMHTFSFADYMKSIEALDWSGVARLMIESAKKVADLGADFALSPDNTIHQSFDEVAAQSPIPWLHIAEELAREASRRNFQQIAVLGTKFLMEGPVYPEKLQRHNIEHRIPNPDERARINEIIFNELVYGKFTDDARRYFYQVIERLKNEGCDAVALSCTEIPLLVRPEESPLPCLDSTRILARAALQKAVENT
ncbi:MAG: amino acid racemase [Candidatus Omnitrophica bacterium]|nr:amino acid racemase [Candidatus Omnitrophota bacterium]